MAQAQRLYFLDWLRVFAFLGLILIHTGLLYISWPYTLKSQQPIPELEWAMLALSPWRLVLLFLISGVASRFLIAKLGAGGFARDRLWRLLPVILFGMFVVIPPQTYVFLLDQGVLDEPFWRFWLFSYLAADQTLVAPFGRTMPTWDHLWFLVYLFVYTIVFALGFGALRLPAGLSPVPRRIPLPVLLSAPAVWLMASAFAIEAYFPITHALIGDWGGHLKWAGMFCLGTLLARRTDFWEALETYRARALALALLLLFALWGLHAGGIRGLHKTYLDGVLWSLASGSYSWSVICAICGYARRYLNRPSALLEHLNGAILPVYVLHQPILLVSAYWLFPVLLPPAGEALLLLAITLFGSFSIYEVVIRPFGPVRFLFGLKPRGAR